MRSFLTGSLLCVTAITILGGSVPVNRVILGYPALTGQAMRYALAALVLALLARRRSTRVVPGPRDLLRLAGLAATGLVGFNVCLLAALRYGHPAIVGAVVGGTPLVLALFGPLLSGRRPAPRLVAAGGIVVTGVALVEGGGPIGLAGIGWATGALAGEALFSLLAAPLLPRLGPVRVSAWACALAPPQLLLGAAVTGEWRRWRAPTGTEAATFAYLAVILTAIAFVCWYGGLSRLGVERAGMFAGLLPVATLVVTAALDGRAPSPLSALGTLVVAAGLVAGLAVGRRTTRPEPATGYPSRSAARTSSA